MTSEHPGSNHLGPETLLRFADKDLSPAESPAIREHMLACLDCREQLEALEEALGEYGRFHRDMLKPSLPAPPAEWPELKFPKARATSLHPMRWLAAAAAIALVYLLVGRFKHAPEVRAAELLRQAAAAEQAAPPSHARVRIQSGSRTLVRAARSGGVETGDAIALHAMFDAAGYSWDDPLSVSAFSRWRDQRPEKQDHIDQTAGGFLVRTSSPTGALSDVELTLRAADLHAVACALRLRSTGETVEMTELPAEAPPVSEPTPTPSRTASIAPASQSPAATTAADELQAIAALHRIGADLGEPIEIQRDGSAVRVQVSGLDENRRSQIRAALAGIPVAQLHFEDVRPATSPAPAPSRQSVTPPEKSNPLIADLQGRVGADVSTSALTDQLIDATDRASERAFALRGLARRFPPDVVSQLSSADSAALIALVRDHTVALAAATQEIRRIVAPILPASPSVASVAGDWQATAESLPNEVEQLDRTLNGATDASSARKAQLAAALAKIEGAIPSLARP